MSDELVPPRLIIDLNDITLGRPGATCRASHFQLAYAAKVAGRLMAALPETDMVTQFHLQWVTEEPSSAIALRWEITFHNGLKASGQTRVTSLANDDAVQVVVMSIRATAAEQLQAEDAAKEREYDRIIDALSPASAVATGASAQPAA